ncbi:flagellin [candidate division LCP-89 bacterium B3_LCP]|uniref:Flagellin n=1 Tax=candidate division LCP-89 bacterium B3_LCP TaxID=2012998 RepID=A0A532UXL2_UNCL8|nr:MAG: flagellin [candidate division LCP-89 bacterium B3_LCP]
MSTRINHNILSMTAQRNLWSTQLVLDRAVQRLSSGLRINNAWDDPAGLAISERFRAQIASMEEAERNANNNINLMQTAEGALSVLDETLTRMRALAIESSNGSLTDSDRQALDVEYQQLLSEVNRISQVTNYNGLYLLDGSFSATGIKFHIGTYNAQSEDYYYVNFNSMTISSLGLTGTGLTTTTSAQNAIGSIDIAIDRKDNERTRLGSYVNRLQGTISQLLTARERAVASESQIRDADFAQEMSEFVRSQILMQSGVAMLAQANMIPQMIAGLVG